jgi:hypothetical protein
VITRTPNPDATTLDGLSYADTQGQVVSGILSYWTANAFNTSTNCGLFGTLFSS